MINHFFGRFSAILIVMVHTGNYWESNKFCPIAVLSTFYRELEIPVTASFILFSRSEKNNSVLHYLPIRASIMMGVNGLCASPFLLFLSLPFAFEIARVSLEKNISTAALIYPDQDLKAEQ